MYLTHIYAITQVALLVRFPAKSLDKEMLVLFVTFHCIPLYTNIFCIVQLKSFAMHTTNVQGMDLLRGLGTCLQSKSAL